ncbi:hypothetical protein BJ138DRAFT_829673 [Hygrophoropsis aurantiaca]|uniref:Uncharacterized protein n=1 Tax=Hygrophoropsis aurantiaca TaxID=72124 RepID=A0ACB8AF09_9AGAM|nr:hypothetical protein BJ138DRAFT_829673 [Hygrophoropsis aurantiaca]
MMSSSFLQRLTDYHSLKQPNRNYKHYSSVTGEMTIFSTLSSASSQYLNAPRAPARKRSQLLKVPRDDVDEFLSSDLELSFASTMSLNSPPRESISLAIDNGEPMDISPAPVKTLQKENSRTARPLTRPRAFTSAARMFGNDVSNGSISNESSGSVSKPPASQSISKRTQRGALPFEWMASSQPTNTFNAEEEGMFSHSKNEPASPTSDDAMDVDPVSIIVTGDLLASPPLSAAPTITGFNNLFYGTMSPTRFESPRSPQPKKRRSLSPEPVRRVEQEDVPSSPVAPSSPSQHRLERMASGSLLSAFNKPMLQGLGAPSNANKRPRRPAFSALVQPSDAPVLSAYPALESGASPEEKLSAKPLPTRRAYSAMLPPSALGHLSDESSFDGPDMSSPAQAYAQRQQVKTIRRRDGTDDFRPLTGATALVQKDIQESPSAKFMNAGIPGFGDNETLGKILPCHRVREDGLMRIKPHTLDALLDGVFDSQIVDYHVIDCRFDYEYDGGHVPGAVNINTTAGVEEFLLGLNRPKPCVSGDSSKKTVLVFHCEFSAKRAPTFAKHLRAKDRAMNNHVYPRIHYPEVYILEGGYCEYYRQCAPRCQPQGYVTMDDPNHALSRREDLDQFRKAKFGRTKSYAYGEGPMKMALQPQPKRNTAPTGATQLFAAANAARTRRNGLSTLAEIGNTTIPTDDEDTDIGDSPCPPPTKGVLSKAKKLGRAPLARAETYDAARMAY